MIPKLRPIDVCVLPQPHYVTTPAALANVDMFVRLNALQLTSWHALLHANDPEGDRVGFGEFAITQYERVQGLRPGGSRHWSKGTAMRASQARGPSAMSRHDMLLMDLAFRALEPRQPTPTNLHVYPSVPEADDTELRERLRHEQQDEPRERWSPYDRETGIAKNGPV